MWEFQAVSEAKQVGPDPTRGYSTSVVQVTVWHEPATDRPDWYEGATHQMVAERTVRTEYGPWTMKTIDGRELPEGQSKWDRLYYKGDGSPGTDSPACESSEPADA